MAIVDSAVAAALDLTRGKGFAPSISVRAGDWHASNPEFNLPTISNRSLTLRLNGFNEISGTVLGADSYKILSRVTDLWWVRDGKEQCRVRVDGVVREHSTLNYSIAFHGEDYRGILTDHRFFQTTMEFLTPTAVEDVVWQIISHTQSQTGGSLNIVRHPTLYPGFGGTNGSGKAVGGSTDTTKISFERGSSIGAAIATLAAGRDEITSDPLFEWDIDVDNRLMLFFPSRGNDTKALPSLLTYPGNVAAYTITEGNDFGNQGQQAGGTGSTAIVSAELDNLSSAAEGRWELYWTNGDLTTDALVRLAASANLVRFSSRIPGYQLVLNPNVWKGRDHIDVGDYVGISINDTYELHQVVVRVLSIVATVSQDNSEQITIELSKPVFGMRDIIRAINRKLRRSDRG
jgi:hypothetical protein